MTYNQDTATINNLEKQKALYCQLLDLSHKQLALLQSTRGDPDTDSLIRLAAERQHLMERIEGLEQSMPRGEVEPGLDRLGSLFRELLEVMRDIEQQDKIGLEIVRQEMAMAGDQLKKHRARKRAVNAYFSCRPDPEGSFFDHRK